MTRHLLISVTALFFGVAVTGCQSDMSGSHASRQELKQSDSDMAQRGARQEEFDKSNGFRKDDMLNQGEANEDDAIREDPGIQGDGK